MEKSSFFNAVADTAGNYDRVYKAEDFADYFNKFIFTFLIVKIKRTGANLIGSLISSLHSS